MIAIFVNPTGKETKILLEMARVLDVPARFTKNNPELPGIPILEFDTPSMEDHYAFLNLCGWDTNLCQFIPNKIPWNVIGEFWV